MTPLPVVPNTIKYTQGWNIGNNLKAESILHFEYSGGPPSASVCAALAAIFQAAAVTEFKGLMATANAVGLGTVQDIASNTGAAGTGGTVTAGTLAVAPYSAATSMVINHAIARRYRGGKPRTYAPFGTSNNLQTAGTFTNSFVSTVTSNWSTFITDCLAASSGGVTITEYRNVSYFSGGSQRVTPATDPILSSLARVQVGSQRRRNKGA